jgi:nitric oxide reductase NorE protein
MNNKIKDKEPQRLPGAEGVWVFVFADMTVFAIMFGSFITDRQRNLTLFEESQKALSLNYGTANTLILLTSSLFVFLAVESMRRSKERQGALFFALSLVFGVSFIVTKILEYSEKFKAGISMLTNDFFMYYFIMTGIHFAHVVVGSIILSALCYKAYNKKKDTPELQAYESGATYWHMVDIIWICLFPLLYLVK